MREAIGQLLYRIEKEHHGTTLHPRSLSASRFQPHTSCLHGADFKLTYVRYNIVTFAVSTMRTVGEKALPHEKFWKSDAQIDNNLKQTSLRMNHSDLWQPASSTSLSAPELPLSEPEPESLQDHPGHCF
jgi:hypothetical protein